ncbi:hypothetical protein [Ekhidna sp.]|uniref:hypothetical protein n=1 Tax=Ekhidna sp. TaxID=2608089 RepID=UPI003CCB8DA1
MLIEILLSTLLTLQQDPFLITDNKVGQYSFCDDVELFRGEVIEDNEYDVKIVSLGDEVWIAFDFNEAGIFRIETNSSKYSLESGICPGSSIPDLFKIYPNIVLDMSFGISFKLVNEEIYFSVDKDFGDQKELETYLAEYGLEKLIEEYFADADVFSIIVVGSC